MVRYSYYHRLSANPGIFTYDYKKMRFNKKDLHRDFIEEMMHPRRIAKYLETHDDVENIYT